MHKPKIYYHIRYAHPSEAQYLTELLRRSKASWGYPQAWLNSWREILTVTPQLIEKNISLIAEHDGVIQGFWCRTPEESREKPTPGFFFVEPEAIGTGCGRQLFEAMKVELLKRGIRSFSVEADPYAASFYIKMGGKQVAEKESSIPGRMLPIIHFDFE